MSERQDRLLTLLVYAVSGCAVSLLIIALCMTVSLGVKLIENL